MFKALFLTIFIINISTSSCVLQKLYQAGQKVWNLYRIIDNKALDVPYDDEDTDNFTHHPMILELKEQLDAIQKNLHELEDSMGSKRIWDTIKIWPLDTPEIRGFETIQLFVGMIDEYYARFNHNRNDNFNSHTSFGVLMTGVSPTLERYINVIRLFATNDEKLGLKEGDLVTAIANFTSASKSDLCDTHEVFSSIIIQLFRIIIIAELQTSIISAHSNIYGYVEHTDKREWRKNNSLAKDNLEKHFATHVNLFMSHMTMIDGVYNRACDPPEGNWLRGESFYELEQTFQAHIFKYQWNNCKIESCNYILNEKPLRCPASFFTEPDFSSPDDTIGECAYLGAIKACLLHNGPHKYQFVQSSKMGLLGWDSPCPEDNGMIINTTRTPIATYAACACNSYSSHNKISLFMMESHVESNRVITGLRFILKDNVLHIQPREGALEANGIVKRFSQRWIPIPEYIHPLLIVPVNKENRVFFLDDLTLPINYVLTGIKFNKVTRGDVGGFAIEIIGSLFNYESGNILPLGNPIRVTRGSDGESGKGLSFVPVSSAFTKLHHVVTTSEIKYVSLERSTLKEDFGQSTVPFFDASPATINVPSALGGVGIFHKGVDGYAGVISLRFYGIQFKEYFNEFKILFMKNQRVIFNSSAH